MKVIKMFLEKQGTQMMSVLTAFVMAGVLINVGVSDFQANVLTDKKSAPFDGTVAPVAKTPNWVALSTSEWKAGYSQIPADKMITLPTYTPSQLIIPASTLNFKNEADGLVRDAQVTYSTPYMGDYKLDGKEYAGSHLGVDIKIPAGTPILAIANGVVIKAASEPSGFGNNVVLRHDNVPSFSDANVKTTYFSGYAHLTNYIVNVGDLVAKGQVIGYSGSSGTATTPHVHFQIDNDQAPWHMYWPFTSKEASDAGVNFFDAVNIGLGKDKAMATTISPMAYVQKYANYQGSDTTPVVPTVNTSSNNSTVPVVVTPILNEKTSTKPDQLPPDTSTVNSNSTGSKTDNSTSSDSSTVTNTFTQLPAVVEPLVVKPEVVQLADLQLKYNSGFVTNAVQTVKVIALDKNANVIRNFVTSGDIYIKVENGSATLSKSHLSGADFQNGIASFEYTPTAHFGVKLSVTAGEIVKSTEMLQESTFTDLSASSDGFVAVNFLKDNNVVKGYSDGSFKPENPVSRVEALKFIYEGLNKPVNINVALGFIDTDSKAWYARYVAAAQKEGIVKGYSSSLFKPSNNVTKAEFLKMLMTAAGFSINNYQPTSKPFDDVNLDAWYSGFVAIAKDRNLLDTSSNKLQPNKAISRGDVADLIYKTVLLKVSGQQRYADKLVVEANDVASFYREI